LEFSNLIWKGLGSLRVPRGPGIRIRESRDKRFGFREVRVLGDREEEW